MHNHCNMCNIRMKQLQHTSETFETLETDACNVQFQCNISLLLGRMDPRRRVEFYPGRRGLHSGKFNPGHDKLGRQVRDMHGRAPYGVP
jgi:hypothetical protein